MALTVAAESEVQRVEELVAKQRAQLEQLEHRVVELLTQRVELAERITALEAIVTQRKTAEINRRELLAGLRALLEDHK